VIALGGDGMANYVLRINLLNYQLLVSSELGTVFGGFCLGSRKRVCQLLLITVV
jgi:hypothetical protein